MFRKSNRVRLENGADQMEHRVLLAGENTLGVPVPPDQTTNTAPPTPVPTTTQPPTVQSVPFGNFGGSGDVPTTTFGNFGGSGNVPPPTAATVVVPIPSSPPPPQQTEVPSSPAAPSAPTPTTNQFPSATPGIGGPGEPRPAEGTTATPRPAPSPATEPTPASTRLDPLANTSATVESIQPSPETLNPLATTLPKPTTNAATPEGDALAGPTDTPIESEAALPASDPETLLISAEPHGSALSPTSTAGPGPSRLEPISTSPSPTSTTREQDTASAFGSSPAIGGSESIENALPATGLSDDLSATESPAASGGGFDESSLASNEPVPLDAPADEISEVSNSQSSIAASPPANLSSNSDNNIQLQNADDGSPFDRIAASPNAAGDSSDVAANDATNSTFATTNEASFSNEFDSLPTSSDSARDENAVSDKVDSLTDIGRKHGIGSTDSAGKSLEGTDSLEVPGLTDAPIASQGFKRSDRALDALNSSAFETETTDHDASVHEREGDRESKRSDSRFDFEKDSNDHSHSFRSLVESAKKRLGSANKSTESETSPTPDQARKTKDSPPDAPQQSASIAQPPDASDNLTTDSNQSAIEAPSKTQAANDSPESAFNDQTETEAQPSATESDATDVSDESAKPSNSNETNESRSTVADATQNESQQSDRERSSSNARENNSDQSDRTQQRTESTRQRNETRNTESAEQAEDLKQDSSPQPTARENQQASQTSDGDTQESFESAPQRRQQPQQTQRSQQAAPPQRSLEQTPSAASTDQATNANSSTQPVGPSPITLPEQDNRQLISEKAGEVGNSIDVANPSTIESIPASGSSNSNPITDAPRRTFNRSRFLNARGPQRSTAPFTSARTLGDSSLEISPQIPSRSAPTDSTPTNAEAGVLSREETPQSAPPQSQKQLTENTGITAAGIDLPTALAALAYGRMLSVRPDRNKDAQNNKRNDQ